MSAVSDALSALWTKLENDELVIVLPLGDSYLSNIVANPDPANIVTQSVALETSVVAAIPNMEAAGAKDAAGALKTLLDLEAASLTAPVVATPPVVVPGATS